MSARDLTRARWNRARLDALVLPHVDGLPDDLRSAIEAGGASTACNLEWVGEVEGEQLAAVCYAEGGPSWMRAEGTRWAEGHMTGMKCLDGNGYGCASWPEGAPVPLSAR